MISVLYYLLAGLLQVSEVPQLPGTRKSVNLELTH